MQKRGTREKNCIELVRVRVRSCRQIEIPNFISELGKLFYKNN